MSEVEVFYLPDVGEGLTEADIVTWHVSVGDTVDVNDVLVDVETAKSVVELPSPFAGTVNELHGVTGETLPVGAALVSIASAPSPGVDADDFARSDDVALSYIAETASPSADTAPPEHVVTAPAADQPLILVGTAPKEAATRRVHVRRPSAARQAPARGTDRRSSMDELSTVLDVADSRSDDTAYPREADGTSRGEFSDELLDARVPVKGVRKATAEAMVRSAFTAPHATVWTSVDVTRTMEAVSHLKADRAWSGLRVSPLLFVARATALAVERFPEVNASWDSDANEIVLKRQLNLGIAAATPRGLLVPNIKNAGALRMRELAEALDDMIVKARAGKLTPADMARGTLTLTNVGTFGIEGAAAIINPPEAAIVAVGAVNSRPWVVDGQLAVRDVMTLSISVDHRLVDGQLAGEVLRMVAEVLADPGATLHLT